MDTAAQGAEGVSAIGPGQQAKAEQERECAEACHDEVEISRLGIATLAMMRYHQRPGGERHQFPGKQKRKCVRGEKNEIHSGKKNGKEGQYPRRRRFMTAIAERVKARRRSA